MQIKEDEEANSKAQSVQLALSSQSSELSLNENLVHEEPLQTHQVSQQTSSDSVTETESQNIYDPSCPPEEVQPAHFDIQVEPAIETAATEESAITVVETTAVEEPSTVSPVDTTATVEESVALAVETTVSTVEPVAAAVEIQTEEKALVEEVPAAATLEEAGTIQNVGVPDVKEATETINSSESTQNAKALTPEDSSH